MKAELRESSPGLTVPTSPLRVFLSYCRSDGDRTGLNRRVADALRQRGLHPLSDGDIPMGANFPEDITSLIRHSHVFMPLITSVSKRRPWVNQEIGIAIGQRIPVLPLTVGPTVVPDGIIAYRNAIRIQDTLSDLDEALDRVNFEGIVDSLRLGDRAMVEVAHWMEPRMRKVIDCANYVSDHKYFGRVRICDRLSAFAAPEDAKGLYGTDQRSEFYYDLARKEHQALQAHAEKAGCDLLIDPTVTVKYDDSKRRTSKLVTLRDFLDNSKFRGCVRVVCSSLARKANMVFVGDWFAGESRFEREGEGWRETIFTLHAPTVRSEVAKFNAHFEELLGKQSPEESRKAAIAKINETLRKIGA